MFLTRLGADKKKYMTKREFLARFWAAYTYTEQKEEQAKAEAESEDPKKKKSDEVPLGPAAIMQSVSHNV